MSKRGHYILTRSAENDLHEARLWSLRRWGKMLTQEYFSDLHRAAEYVAGNHQALKSRDDLTSDTGLSVYPVREHYLIYLPVAENQIVIVAVMRQSRDIPQILGKASFMIQREVADILNRIDQGEILL